MDRGESIGMERTVTDQIIHEGIVAILRICHILKSGFLGECIIVQPVGEKTIHTDAPLHILGCMHMKIRKGRNDHLSSVICDRHSLILLRHLRINSLDTAFFYYDITVFMNGQFIC